MEAKEIIFMSKGEGENSFAQNSSFTQRVAELSKPALERTVQSLITEDFRTNKVLNVVDLGCSSSPTSFSVMSTVIQNVKNKCQELNFQIPEFQFYLNDLPGNDFNTLFKGLPKLSERFTDVSCFFTGVPGSFHGRLFPSNSLHLVHSSYGVHWLSKMPRLRDEAGLPLNKGKIYISTTSPAAVKEAYLTHFKEDLSLFLKSRSQEMVRNGRVFFVIPGRPSADQFPIRESLYPWEPLAQSISSLVSEGVIEEEKLDAFDIPYYTPSQQEVRETVEKEGSFTMELLDKFVIEIGDENTWENVEKLSKNIRAFTESMISHHFGEEILDKLYDKFTQLSIQDSATSEQPYKIISFIIVLRRN